MKFSPDLRSFDKSDYLKVLTLFDAQLTEAKKSFENQQTVLDSIKRESIASVVVCGMGGSAIAGDFIRNILQADTNYPIQVIRDYRLPAYVGKHSLVILSSYSGNTEETLSAFEEARQRGSQKVAMTTGGRLAEMAAENNVALLTIPGGLQPRQALPYSLVTLFGIMQALLTDRVNWSSVDEAIALGGPLSKAYAPDGSECLLDTAVPLTQKPVTIYSSESMFPAAVRMKGQFSENAKILAFAAPVPEMNHNEIVGWEGSAGSCNAIIIRDDHDHPNVAARLDILTDLLSKKTHVISIRCSGKSLLARFVSLIIWSDWVTYYTALLRKTDPTPVDIITYLKNELAKLNQK